MFIHKAAVREMRKKIFVKENIRRCQVAMENGWVAPFVQVSG
jgi:hypothetical protein